MFCGFAPFQTLHQKQRLRALRMIAIKSAPRPSRSAARDGQSKPQIQLDQLERFADYVRVMDANVTERASNFVAFVRNVRLFFVCICLSLVYIVARILWLIVAHRMANKGHLDALGQPRGLPLDWTTKETPYRPAIANATGWWTWEVMRDVSYNVRSTFVSVSTSKYIITALNLNYVQSWRLIAQTKISFKWPK